MGYTKGQTGNPGGQPKVRGKLSISKALLKFFEDNEDEWNAIILAGINHAKRSPRGWEMLMDRAFGRVPQALKAEIEVAHHVKRIEFQEPQIPEPELPREVDAEVVDGR